MSEFARVVLSAGSCNTAQINCEGACQMLPGSEWYEYGAPPCDDCERCSITAIWVFSQDEQGGCTVFCDYQLDGYCEYWCL